MLSKGPPSNFFIFLCLDMGLIWSFFFILSVYFYSINTHCLQSQIIVISAFIQNHHDSDFCHNRAALWLKTGSPAPNSCHWLSQSDRSNATHSGKSINILPIGGSTIPYTSRCVNTNYTRVKSIPLGITQQNRKCYYYDLQEHLLDVYLAGTP